MKTIIKLTISFLLSIIAFTADCSQKEQHSVLEILPEGIIEKIISHTPIATRKSLALVNKAISEQAYCQLEKHRTNSFKNYLRFQDLLFQYFSPEALKDGSIIEHHAPNFQTNLSLQLYRPHIVQFANYVVSVIQNPGIATKNQKTILDELLSREEKIFSTGLERTAKQCMNQQNQLFKLSVLSLSFSALSRGNEMRNIQKKMFERIFFTLLNLNAFEETNNISCNLPMADSEYLISLIKQLNINANYKFENNATLLQNCFSFAGKTDRPKTQYQVMLIYELIKLGVDLSTLECERTLACFFRHLSQFQSHDQIGIFNRFIKNNGGYDMHETILHSYFKYASIVNPDIINTIIEESSFDINAIEPVISPIDLYTSGSEEEPILDYFIERRTSFEYFVWFCSRLKNDPYLNVAAAKIAEIFIAKQFDFEKKTGTGKSFTDLVDAYLEKDNDNLILAYLKGMLQQNQKRIYCSLKLV